MQKMRFGALPLRNTRQRITLSGSKKRVRTYVAPDERQYAVTKPVFDKSGTARLSIFETVPEKGLVRTANLMSTRESIEIKNVGPPIPFDRNMHKGAGLFMMVLREAILASKGKKDIILEAKNTDLQSYYATFGFERVLSPAEKYANEWAGYGQIIILPEFASRLMIIPREKVKELYKQAKRNMDTFENHAKKKSA